MRGMKDRAHQVCNPFPKPKELQHLDEVFQANVFPGKWFPHPPGEEDTDRVPKTATRWRSGAHQTTRDPIHPLHSWTQWETEEDMYSLNIGNVFTTASTLKQVVMQIKLWILEKKKRIVYQVPCKDCDGVYTGESKGTLKVRLTEHKCAVVGSDVNNGIAVHVSKNEHSVDWGNVRVLRSVRVYW